MRRSTIFFVDARLTVPVRLFYIDDSGAEDTGFAVYAYGVALWRSSQTRSASSPHGVAESW